MLLLLADCLPACVLVARTRDTFWAFEPLVHTFTSLRHRRTQDSINKTTVAPIKPPRNVCTESHCPLRATEKQLSSHSKPRARHSEPLKCHVTGLGLPRSRVTGPVSSMFSVALLAHRSWSRECPGQLFHFRARQPHRKQHKHQSRLTNETCYTPMAAHTNHGHTHRGTATVPLILPSHEV